MRNIKFCALALVISLLLAFTWSYGNGKKPPLLDRDTVKTWLSDGEVIILDVRAPKDWIPSDKKIKGAARRNPDEVQTWAASLPKDKIIVLY
jgi:rhodanese-related sulfurtransferase